MDIYGVNAARFTLKGAGDKLSDLAGRTDHPLFGREP